MKFILRITLKKTTIKLCFIVLLIFVFVNEGFSQSYNSERYSGSYSHSLYHIVGLMGINSYEISVRGNYNGGGSLLKPIITGYLYVSSFTFNNTYSYNIIRKNVDIRDEQIVIYYDYNSFLSKL